MNKEEIYKAYKPFAEDFVLHFPENERQKVRELLDFLMNSRSHALEDSDIEDLFYVFSENALKNGAFHYKEFSSWAEIENWEPQCKIEEAYLVLSFSEDPFNADVTDIQRIYNSLIRHFSSPESANLGFYYYENEENLPSKLIYVLSACCD